MIPLIYNDRATLDLDGNQTSNDQFIKDTIDQLKEFQCENAFKIYRQVKHKYNKYTQQAFFAIPIFRFFYHSFVNSSDVDAFLADQNVRSDIAENLSQTEQNQYKIERKRW